MARPCRARRICAEPDYDYFVPAGYPGGPAVTLTLDEFETLRLVDLEKLTHEQCAARMDVSRTTVTEIYESAREKVAESIVCGRPLAIAGGQYRLCRGEARCGRCGEPCKANTIRPKGECTMRFAVTYENGSIFQHFGHTAQFKLYDVENGAVSGAQVVDTNGSGHGALAGFLKAQGVDTLICGGIGGGAQAALAEAGIALYGGVSGEADAAVAALLAGSLGYDPLVRCSHHDHEHGEGHTCGEHGCHHGAC